MITPVTIISLGTIAIAFGLFINSLFTSSVFKKNKELALKLETLANETREALAQHDLNFNGVRDTVVGMHKDVGLFQKELAEFAKTLEGDELTKIQDRLSLMELKLGFNRTNTVKEALSR